MTDKHPIVPPLELVHQWDEEGTEMFRPEYQIHLTTRAAQWGADQELEACREWTTANFGELPGQNLYLFRRFKPPSLKEQALEAMRGMRIEPCILDGVNANAALQARYDIIIRALEALPDD